MKTITDTATPDRQAMIAVTAPGGLTLACLHALEASQIRYDGVFLDRLLQFTDMDELSPAHGGTFYVALGATFDAILAARDRQALAFAMADIALLRDEVARLNQLLSGGTK